MSWTKPGVGTQSGGDEEARQTILGTSFSKTRSMGNQKGFAVAIEGKTKRRFGEVEGSSNRLIAFCSGGSAPTGFIISVYGV